MRVQSKVALRGMRQNERMKKLSEAAPKGVRVVPQEKYRAVLKHANGKGFPAEGGTEWPDDRFTRRRLADGSVTRESEGETKRPDHYRPPQSKKDEPHDAA